MISPCCFGISLKRGAKIIAILELTASIIFAIAVIGHLIELESGRMNLEKPRNNSTTSAKISGTVITPFFSLDQEHEIQYENMKVSTSSGLHEFGILILLLLLIGEIVLSWILFRGASQEKFTRLRIWWWVKLTLMLSFLLYDIVGLFTGKNRKLEYVICLQVLYQAYVLWVVKALMDEIRVGGLPFSTLTNTVPDTLIENDEDDI